MSIQKDMDVYIYIYIYIHILLYTHPSIYIFICNICLTIKKNTREYNFEILLNMHI